MGKRLGAEGEIIVRMHLERLGWRVLASNYRCKAGEMDLIAEERNAQGTTLVFIEVKTRRSREYGAPIEAVDGRKQQKLIQIAQSYLGERDAGGAEPNYRFDVAEVRFGPDRYASVTLHRAAFVAA
ncbi:MAG TPA: YraN family protein [Chthonomonadaceae bacterium]|nr:YraN family protein [Chthonomonadaceae bacterium]